MPKSVNTNQEVSRSSSSARYNVIPEGTYYGVIRQVEWKTFNTRVATMEKFTPRVELFHENQTVIDRQDFTIGAVDGNGVYTNEPFNNPDASVIFAGYDMEKGNFGARGFMFATGMLNGRGDVNFNENAIVDMVVRVTVKTRKYTHRGVDRYENVIIYWDTVKESDIEALNELGVDTSEWVVFNMCVLEPDGDALPEFTQLVFETEAAFDVWFDTFYGESEDWKNPIGQLGTDLEEYGFQTFSNLIGYNEVAEEEPVETIGGDDPLPM